MNRESVNIQEIFSGFLRDSAGKDPKSLAATYVLVCLLRSFCEYKIELFKPGKKAETEIEVNRVAELSSKEQFTDLDFLSPYLASMGRIETSVLLVQLRNFEGTLLGSLRDMQTDSKVAFHREALSRMQKLFDYEFAHPDSANISLYRCFDSMDAALGLDYSEERKMPTQSLNGERIFSGSAEGVQSSYSTIFAVLRELNPLHGSTLMDLGCGFGRVGLVIGLHRPDMNFIGYEYVNHRVEAAQSCAQELKIEGQVHFRTQDLSDREFSLPIANIYYMYDPFSESTYRFILDQIVKISKKQSVSVVTKGNAKDWLLKIAKDYDWQPVRSFDYGNLNLFTSS